MYTFFSDAVSSSPSFDFPKCPSSSHSHGPHPVEPLAAASQGWEGVAASAVGMGMSDDGEYAYGYAEQEQEQEQEDSGPEYDPNGVLITPGSPDKAAEPMLWPAR